MNFVDENCKKFSQTFEGLRSERVNDFIFRRFLTKILFHLPKCEANLEAQPEDSEKGSGKGSHALGVRGEGTQDP